MLLTLNNATRGKRKYVNISLISKTVTPLRSFICMVYVHVNSSTHH